MITRRHLIATAGALASGGAAFHTISDALAQAPKMEPGLPQGIRTSARLEALPGKKPLIKLSYRPPNYETPLEYFRSAITPNDAFFVRYHLSFIPEVDVKTWKINVGGEGANSPFELNMDALK